MYQIEILFYFKIIIGNKEESLSTWLLVLSYHDSDYTNVGDLQLL